MRILKKELMHYINQLSTKLFEIEELNKYKYLVI